MSLQDDINLGSMITDHPFEAKGELWSLCRVCNLAEAAHRDAVQRYEPSKEEGNEVGRTIQ